MTLTFNHAGSVWTFTRIGFSHSYRFMLNGHDFGPVPRKNVALFIHNIKQG